MFYDVFIRAIFPNLARDSEHCEDVAIFSGHFVFLKKVSVILDYLLESLKNIGVFGLQERRDLEVEGKILFSKVLQSVEIKVFQ